MSKQSKVEEKMEIMLASGKGPTIMRFLLSALGSIPGIGGLVSATAGAWSEKEQKDVNNIFKIWLKIQKEELEQIGNTLSEVLVRLDVQDEKINERVTSKEYLNLVKKVFRDWSASDSGKKRTLLRNLLVNAASCSLTTDDVIKMFIDWIDKYTETHFNVIGLLYNNEGITRYNMWMELYGEKVREDSAEADLFKLIIHDLSIGHVIRQYRKTDRNGRFIKNTNSTRRKTPYMKSAFDNEKPYVLTELGKQFVHYTMNEIVPKIEQKDEA